MSVVHLRRIPQGFVPDTDDDWEACTRFTVGSVVKADVVNPRNYRFFCKWFALVKVGFGLWEETGVAVIHKGEKVRPNFSRFRKDVTILAGYHHPVININGELRLEADSIAFGKMDEDTFEKLYEATLATIVQKVMRGRITEERLREMAQAVEEFA